MKYIGEEQNWACDEISTNNSADVSSYVSE